NPRVNAIRIVSHTDTTPGSYYSSHQEEGRTEYTGVTDAPPEDGFETNWDVLRMVFEDASQKLTRRDVLEKWPADSDKPSASNLAKVTGPRRMALEGSGRKADPFRYWLSEREAVWKKNPLYEFLEQQKRDLKLT